MVVCLVWSVLLLGSYGGLLGIWLSIYYGVILWRNGEYFVEVVWGIGEVKYFDDKGY